MADNDSRCFVKGGDIYCSNEVYNDIYCSNEVYNKVLADLCHKYFIPSELSLDVRIFVLSSDDLDVMEKEFILSRKGI